MKPTLAELEKISTETYQYKQSAGDEFDSTELALKIHALFNPPMKPLRELANPEILAEIEHIKQQVDIISERRLNLEREMFFRNNLDVNP